MLFRRIHTDKLCSEVVIHGFPSSSIHTQFRLLQLKIFMSFKKLYVQKHDHISQHFCLANVI